MIINALLCCISQQQTHTSVFIFTFHLFLFERFCVLLFLSASPIVSGSSSSTFLLLRFLGLALVHLLLLQLLLLGTRTGWTEDLWVRRRWTGYIISWFVVDGHRATSTAGARACALIHHSPYLTVHSPTQSQPPHVALVNNSFDTTTVTCSMSSYCRRQFTNNTHNNLPWPSLQYA